MLCFKITFNLHALQLHEPGLQLLCEPDHQGLPDPHPHLRKPKGPRKQKSQSVRFRPDRPRQPELSRKLVERNPQPPLVAGRSAPRASMSTLKPYQLKPKRGKETFMEPPVGQKESPPPLAGCSTPLDPKKLKRMKKKLDELNRKIRHSRKKHDGMIHKRNALRKVIEVLKHGTKPEPVPEPEWNFKEHEQAFGGAYRSYMVNGRPRIDVDTFFS